MTTQLDYNPEENLSEEKDQNFQLHEIQVGDHLKNQILSPVEEASRSEAEVSKEKVSREISGGFKVSPVSPFNSEWIVREDELTAF